MTPAERARIDEILDGPDDVPYVEMYKAAADLRSEVWRFERHYAALQKQYLKVLEERDSDD